MRWDYNELNELTEIEWERKIVEEKGRGRVGEKVVAGQGLEDCMCDVIKKILFTW